MVKPGSLPPEDDTSAEVVHVVDMEEGVYLSVVAAAFGGLTQDATSGPRSEKLSLNPLLMLMLCPPLFIAQMTILVMLRLDQDLEHPVYGHSFGHVAAEENVWFEMIGQQPSSPEDDYSDLTHVTGVTMLKAKVLMVLILQLVFYSKLQTCLRMLVFLLNPTTWIDVKRQDPHDVKLEIGGRKLSFFYSAYFLAPITWIAMAMKLTVVYNVLVDSVSIILVSADVKQAIFNSLAVSFIGELNIFFYFVLAEILHLNSFRGFEFTKAGDSLRESLRKHNLWDYLEDKIGADTTLCFCKFKYFHRGQGARRGENISVSLFMFALYFRQVGLILEALHSNVLPVARDICTYYHLQTGTGHTLFESLLAMAWHVFSHVLLINPRLPIEARGKHFCNGDGQFARYEVMETSEMLMTTYPKIWWGTLCIIFMSVVAPQLFFAFNVQLRSLLLGSDSRENVRSLLVGSDAQESGYKPAVPTRDGSGDCDPLMQSTK